MRGKRKNEVLKMPRNLSAGQIQDKKCGEGEGKRERERNIRLYLFTVQNFACSRVAMASKNLPENYYYKHKNKQREHKRSNL